MGAQENLGECHSSLMFLSYILYLYTCDLVRLDNEEIIIILLRSMEGKVQEEILISRVCVGSDEGWTCEHLQRGSLRNCVIASFSQDDRIIIGHMHYLQDCIQGIIKVL